MQEFLKVPVVISWFLLFLCAWLLKLTWQRSLSFKVWLLCPTFLILPLVLHLSRLTHLFFNRSELGDLSLLHLSSLPTSLSLLDFCFFVLLLQRSPALIAIQAKAPTTARYSHKPIPIFPEVWSLIIRMKKEVQVWVSSELTYWWWYYIFKKGHVCTKISHLLEMLLLVKTSNGSCTVVKHSDPHPLKIFL